MHKVRSFVEDKYEKLVFLSKVKMLWMIKHRKKYGF